MYSFKLVTPEEIVLEATVYAVIAPGVEGYLEILKGHAPILVLLREGDLKVMLDAKETRAYIVGTGFLEVSDGQCTVLVDMARKGVDIVQDDG